MASRQVPETPVDTVRLAELLGAVSLVGDMGVGLALETSLGAAILAARIAAGIGLPGRVRAACYYTTLLRFLGCTAISHEAALLGAGDDRAFLAAFVKPDAFDQRDLATHIREGIAPEAPPDVRAEAAAQVLADPTVLVAGAEGHCTLALRLASELPVDDAVREALAQTYERWDGRGLPRGLRGDQVSIAAQVMRLASALEMHRRSGGLGAAIAVAQTRSGGEFNPDLVALVVRDRGKLLAGLDDPSLWDAFLAAEPDFHVAMVEMEPVAKVAALMVDHKSVFTLGHSTGVADLAQAAARAAGLSDAEARRLRLAGFVHDLGRAGVPNGIWDKPGRLSPMERTRVEMHSFLTETILAASPALASLIETAGAVHERSNGSGYHRRLRGGDTAASVLAASDVFCALREDRPWRKAYPDKEAGRILRQEATEGRLTRDAVTAVLDAAGVRAGRSRSAWPAALSDREVDVLRLVARGLTNQAIASELFIARKTVEHHLEHIYEKTGIRSRVAAAVFAVDNGLFEK